LFGVPNSEGLTDSLLSPTFDPHFIRQTGVDCLSILTTGALPPNPAELLGSKRMHDLNKQLHAQADIVIFDGPPCLPVTDPAVLANLVDGVILVVDMTQTRRKDAQRAKEILSKVGARMLGVVLNRVQPSKSNYYYTYDSAPNGRKRKNKTKPKPSAS
jgi:capsular exopolysaccharide synthesis family protein